MASVPVDLAPNHVQAGIQIIYALVEYFNIKRLQILERDHRNTKYTLSIRYQLKENLKTLKLMRRFFITIIVTIIVMGLANSVPVLLNWSDDVIMTTRIYMDYVFHSNPVLIVPTALLTIEHYRKYVLNKARSTLGMRVQSQKMDTRKLRPQISREADVFFEIFERQLGGDISPQKKRGGSVRKSKNTVKH